MDEPRTHYQISLTARQAVGLFVGLLVSLGVAFFFGLMTGLSGREAAPREGSAPPGAEDKPAPGPSEARPVETAVPAASASGPSRTELAGAVPAAQAAMEPATPSKLRPFEDSSAEETFPAPVAGKAPASSAAKAPATARAAEAASGKVWVQVASLTSHDEAGALAGRLSKHGFHAVLLTTSGPKGKVYRVRVGPYRSEEEAGKAASKLSKQDRIKQPWVVPEGK